MAARKIRALASDRQQSNVIQLFPLRHTRPTPPAPASRVMMTRHDALDGIMANAKAEGRKLQVRAYVTAIALARDIERLAQLAGSSDEVRILQARAFRCLVAMEAAHAA